MSLFAGVSGGGGGSGTPGADGNTILYGSGAPSNGIGKDGDSYIDTTAHAIYGPKTSGAWGAGTSLMGVNGSPTLEVMELWGSGADGNLTMSSGTLTLARDMFYNNVTLSGTASINTNGYRLHVAGVLDISAAPAGAIHCDAFTVSQTVAATSAAVSQGAPGQTGTYFGGGTANTSAIGSTGAGVQAASVSSNVGMNGGQGGIGGAGGASGTGNAGGASRTPNAVTSAKPLRRLDLFTTNLMGGQAAASGSSGGGDGTNSSNSGAGAPAGAGVVCIIAKVINRGASTAVGAIRSNGQNGGAFASWKTTGNIGGYGGAGGSGGGWVLVVYGALAGATATNAIAVDGGSGSTGGAGFGSGVGGQGGGGGGCGRVTLMNVGGGSITEAVTPSAIASAASVPTGAASAGSAGTAGVQGRANL